MRLDSWEFYKWGFLCEIDNTHITKMGTYLRQDGEIGECITGTTGWFLQLRLSLTSSRHIVTYNKQGNPEITSWGFAIIKHYPGCCSVLFGPVELWWSKT